MAMAVASSVPSAAARIEPETFGGPGEAETVCSVLEQQINAPPDLVWGVVRNFAGAARWAPLVRRCEAERGGGGAEQRVVRQASGGAGTWRRERVRTCDDAARALLYSVVAGDSGLENASVATHVKEVIIGGREMSLVQQCYWLPLPPGSTKDDALTFINFWSGLNLRYLATYAESLALEKGLMKSCIL